MRYFQRECSLGCGLGYFKVSSIHVGSVHSTVILVGN